MYCQSLGVLYASSKDVAVFVAMRLKGGSGPFRFCDRMHIHVRVQHDGMQVWLGPGEREYDYWPARSAWRRRVEMIIIITPERTLPCPVLQAALQGHAMKELGGLS